MSNKCQLGTILSYGSEGTVYSGSWSGKAAAIKVFQKNFANRAENEMKIVSSLNHINVIKYFDLEYNQGCACIAMEYITGGNLYEFIQRNFSSTSYWTMIGSILTDIARGMIYLHARNIVQGDLKSHNILLRKDTCEAVICDFGISRVLDHETGIKKRYQTAKGTIRWMAPEICTPPPEESSFESDVWGFGCIILETTSGREPWTDQFNDDGILFRTLQRKENASIFSQICHNQYGPSHICKLLIQCCSWSKAARPQFADILACLETENYENTITDEQRPDQMLIDPPSSTELYSLEKDTRTIVSKTRRTQGRLTGEVYTSKGNASGRPIYEGPQGGRYYLTPTGSKVYLHK